MTRPRSFRAAAALAWGAAWFLAFHLAFEATLRDPLTQWCDPEFQQRRATARARLAAPSSSDARPPLFLAMLGSSRTDNAFLGAVAEERFRSLLGRDVRAVNFGFAATRAGRSLVDFGRLLRDGPLPDLLLVEASFVRLADALLDESGPPHLGKLSEPDRGWLLRHGLVVPPAPTAGPAFWRRRANLLAAVLPPLALDGYGGRWHHPRRDPHGGSPFPLEAVTPARCRAALEQMTAEYQTEAPQVRCGGPQLTALRALLGECRTRRIPVALVCMPEGPVFRRWYAPGVAEAARGMLFDLAAETGAEVVDAWKWFDDDAFLDGHHMLLPAAEKFTARVAEEAAARWRRGLAPEGTPPPREPSPFDPPQQARRPAVWDAPRR